MLTHPQHRYAQLHVSTVHTVQNFEVIIVSRLLYRLGRAEHQSVAIPVGDQSDHAQVLVDFNGFFVENSNVAGGEG